jgi:hypothetical protein
VTYTVPGNVRLARHVGDLSDDGHDSFASASNYVNVKLDYGAVGDGTTDDTAAIQAAIDDWKTTGATIFFPRGTYKITATLDVDPGSAPTGNIFFLGEGSGEGSASIIDQATSNTSAFKGNSNLYVLAFENLYVHGPGGASSGTGIWGNTRNVQLKNVRVQGFYYGVRVGASAYYSILRDSVIYSNASHGIWQESGSNNMRVDSCHVGANGGIGIKIDASESTKIINGSVEGNGSFGISVDSAGGQTTDGTYIAGVYFEGNGSAQIKVGDTAAPRGTTIFGCFFTSSSGYFIDVKNADYVTIGANDFYTGAGSQTADIRLQTGVTHAVLFNNRPSGAGNTYTATPIILEDLGASGTAGGDLSGTYPNPTVAKWNGVSISGTPSSGQVPTATSPSAATWQTPATPPSGATDHEHIQNIVFSGDGSTTVWEIPAAPVAADAIAVYVTGSRSIAWALSGTMLTTLTFDSAPANAANNIVIDIVAATA